MSGDDFDRLFGEPAPPRPSFVDRVSKPEPARREASHGVEVAAALDALAGADYRPFGTLPGTGGPRACEVRRWIDGTEIPEGIVFHYRLLLRIDFTGEEELRLVLPDTLVSLHGARLDVLRQALMREQVTFIQQYSPRVWPGGKKQGEPVINIINIMRGDARG